MPDEIPSNQAYAMLRPDQRLELRPPRLELLLAVDLLALGYLLEDQVDLWPVVLAKGDLGKLALIEDRDGRSV